MGTWRVGPDLLARACFTLAPQAEIVSALMALLYPGTPAERAFRASHQTAFAAMLDQYPLRRVLLEHSFRLRRGTRPGWVASYLSAPPAVPNVTIEEQLAAVAATADSALRADLEETMLGPLSPELAAPGLAHIAADLLQWIWTDTLETDWPCRERILQGDVVARTGRLATHGWAAVVDDLGRDTEWVGDGHLRINRYDLPTLLLPPEAQLYFIPVLSHDSWVGWTEPATYALYYPATGRLADAETGRVSGLDRLIGVNRANLLRLLDNPASTTHLAASAELPLGSVGNHLRILLDSRLVSRRRSGRTVLYWRTPLGDSLIAAEG